MSPNNWTECPRCLAEAKAEKKQQAIQAEQAYGKVDAKEYQKLLRAANSAIEVEETLREDYGIGIYDGKFKIKYRAWCNYCT